MISLDVGVKGNFARQLQARIDKWGGAHVAARLRVPPELSWWYWQEFGTAVRGDAGRASGRAYDIEPVSAEILVFPNKTGGVTRTPIVEAHEGIPPSHFVQEALPIIREYAQAEVRKALTAPGGTQTPDNLRGAVLESTRNAKEKICVYMDVKLPGSRPPGEDFPAGRLDGRTAVEVFYQGAEVVPVNE